MWQIYLTTFLVAEATALPIDWDRVGVTGLLGVVVSALSAFAYRQFNRQQKHAEQCEEAYQALAMFVLELHTKSNLQIDLPEKIKELATRRTGKKPGKNGEYNA